MRYCPITYEEIDEQQYYSEHGLKLLSPQLKKLDFLNYSAEEQRTQALARAGKMSIQGVQSKLSAQLKIKEGCFELVDQYGRYILKPQNEYYRELPENEAITMTLASTLGIEIPVHGLVNSKDNTMTYFIKRFDRIAHNKKLSVEDFAQLSQSTRDNKYNSSMEKIVKIVTQFCTFPKIEMVKLFKLVLFNFLIGNEDMHLKNFSVITRDSVVTLSPSYDLLNTTIAQPQTREEMALPLNGKKNNLTKKDFFEYFADEQLNLNSKMIENSKKEIKILLPKWHDLIGRSFLSNEMKNNYLNLLNERSRRLEI